MPPAIYESTASYFYFFIVLFIPKEILLCIYLIQACPSSGRQARSSVQPLVQRPGTNFGCSRHWSDDDLLHVFFLVGGYIWRNPREHGENMQTPHRKALFFDEISHLGSGGNRTQDLLAVRRQLYH